MSDHYQPPGIETDQFASALGVKGATVRSRLCKTGSYYGIKPRRMPNGRLRWDERDIDRLLSGEVVE